MSETAVEYNAGSKETETKGVSVVQDGIQITEMFWDWIFVNPIEDPMTVKSACGLEIALPASKDVVTKGTIVAVGPECDKNIRVGDKVLFKRRVALDKFDLDGLNVLVFKKDQLLGILFGDNAQDVNPLGEYVFLFWEYGSKTYGGSSILRPESFKQMHYTGIVKAIGPDCKQFKVGDRVIFDRYEYAENFQEDDSRYIFITEKHIYCKIPDRLEHQKEG